MAKRKFGEKSQALYRVQKFEIKPTEEELTILLSISEVLKTLFNSALAERLNAFNAFIAPFYVKLKSATLEEVVNIRRELKTAYSEHSITLFDQINVLTARRVSDEAFAAVTRNWQEETLDALDGAFKSFIALRKNGDMDARPPRARDEEFFQKIPGRSGFKIDGGRIILSCGGGRKVSFPIPEYQQGKLAEAVRLKKFELYRDEPNLARSGRFWISVAYELQKPETITFNANMAVYLALGASSIGVVSAVAEETLSLWRSDKYWVPKIEAVEQRMKKRINGSRGWQCLYQAKRRMQVISSRQRLQDEREIADYLINKHGVHFVVTELVVRSKPGKLADKSKPERRGRLGLNWAAQNVGSLGRLVLQLEEKVKERGGSVQKHLLILEERPSVVGHENKIWMARKLRDSFLAGILA
ncbi:MAG: hypothetical protein AAB641_01580 [Patescibacteria group bacterium]